MDAFKIADWFIAHNNAVIKYNSADAISNLKIQKLLYYAQGCSLATLGKTLFNEDIIAWKHGPVVEEVYQKYHQYGSNGITDIPDYPLVDQETEKLLINTYNYFAKYSAWELANLTHREDPWRLTPKNCAIPVTLIKNYFTIHYKDVNIDSDMISNIAILRETADLKENWDGEGGLAFSKPFIQEVIDLISTMQNQPDIGVTGRGSLDFEYGSFVSGDKYLDIEIYEKDRVVRVLQVDSAGRQSEETIGMEDINGRVQQF